MWRFAVLALALVSAHASVPLTGVNLASAEFTESTTPGTYGTDYVYPTSTEYSYWAGKGANLIRLPFTWGRLQQSVGATFNSAEQARLEAAVTGITSLGMAVILDPHNYARYPSKTGTVIGASGATASTANFADFWTKLATLFKSNKLVIFELMNEPNSMSSALWFADAQAAITAIRATGATNLILAPGNGWTGGHSWLDTWVDSDGTLSNANGWVTLSDPGNNMMVDIHQYLDSGYSGTGSTCESTTVGSTKLASFTSWARTKGFKAFLTEFAGGTGSNCESAVSDLLTYMDSNSDVWAGWTWWAAGPWWGEYIFTLEPTSSGTDRTQTAWVKTHFSSTSAATYLASLSDASGTAVVVESSSPAATVVSSTPATVIESSTPAAAIESSTPATVIESSSPDTTADSTTVDGSAASVVQISIALLLSVVTLFL